MRVESERVRVRGHRLAAATGVFALAALVLSSGGPASADAIRNREYWLAGYGITEAWNTTRGEGVTIAIIDTGVDATHPDLAGAVVAGEDFTGNGRGGKPVAGQSHGTSVASLAAGRGHGSDDGVIGVAPAASILSASVAFGDGIDSDTQVADAINWAIDNGADVINMSFTRETLDWPESWDTAFLRAEKAGIVMVAAAGNRGSGTAVVGAPATIPGVLTVAGVDAAGTSSTKASSQGITIGVAAPSERLVAAVPGGGYTSFTGTSGAAPIVAGLVALVKAAHPELSAGAIINRIVRTARPAGADGVDALYGYGLFDAAAAVSDAPVEAVTAAEAANGNPLGELTEWIRMNRRAAPPMESAVPVERVEPVETPASADPIAALLPSTAQLRDIGLPALVLGAGGLVLLTLVATALRHAFGRRQKG